MGKVDILKLQEKINSLSIDRSCEIENREKIERIEKEIWEYLAHASMRKIQIMHCMLEHVAMEVRLVIKGEEDWVNRKDPD